MAHTRKDTFSAPGEWARHLKRQGKRAQAKAERRAAQTIIRSERLAAVGHD
jgi:hypothetical protein